MHCLGSVVDIPCDSPYTPAIPNHATASRMGKIELKWS
jgi:hypothetical protein